MTLVIVPFYAGICAIIYAILTIRSIQARMRHKVSLGNGTDMAFTRVIRAHGNFFEYAPFILFLLALLELRQVSPIFLHIAGFTLVVTRIIHAIGVTRGRNEITFRTISMAPTIGLLIITGLMNIYMYVAIMLTSP